MKCLVGVVTGRPKPLLVRNVLLFFAISQPSVFTWNRWNIFIIECFTQLSHLFHSLSLGPHSQSHSRYSRPHALSSLEA